MHIEPLTDTEIAQIAQLAADIGDKSAADRLLIHASTLTKALARRPLRRSTTVCIRAGLRELQRGSGGLP